MGWNLLVSDLYHSAKHTRRNQEKKKEEQKEKKRRKKKGRENSGERERVRDEVELGEDIEAERGRVGIAPRKKENMRL